MFCSNLFFGILLCPLVCARERARCQRANKHYYWELEIFICRLLIPWENLNRTKLLCLLKITMSSENHFENIAIISNSKTSFANDRPLICERKYTWIWLYLRIMIVNVENKAINEIRLAENSNVSPLIFHKFEWLCDISLWHIYSQWPHSVRVFTVDNFSWFE